MSNLLSVCRPDLFAQLHPTKNAEAGIDIQTLTRGSRTLRAYWVCSTSLCGHHVWIAKAAARINGTGCPFCAGKQTCPCLSFMTIPHVAATFAADLNPDVDPQAISTSSGKRLWWRCIEAKCEHHVWHASVASRTGGNGCPFCTGKQTCPCLSFMNNTLLGLEFAADLNPDVDPWIVPTMSSKKLRWRCSTRTCAHHVWDTAVSSRSNGSGCPYCVGRKTCPCNSFMINHLLAKEFALDLNSGIDPHEVAALSSKGIWWRCSTTTCSHHVWKANINDRNGPDETGCPFCAGKQTCPCDSFMNNPLLSKEFAPDLNPCVDPHGISVMSSKAIWWRCSVATCSHHIWEAVVSSRSIGRGCPYCSGKETCPCLSFMTNPILAREFDNKINPDENSYMVPKGSHKYLNWRCVVCSNIWRAKVSDRTSGTGCPECARTRTESKGAGLCREYLEHHEIPYKREFKLQYFEKRRYDFMFHHRGRNYLLEFDGEQHFKKSSWHASTAVFLENQEIDKLKNWVALSWGYTVLRISNNDATHVTAALDYFLQIECKEPFFGIDDQSAYMHMFKPIPPDVMSKHCPQYAELTAVSKQPGPAPTHVFSSVPKHTVICIE